MKINNSIFFILMLALIGSCKKETPLDELPLVIPKPIPNDIEVVLNMVVEKDDVFEIFYTEDGSINFGALNVRVRVFGSPKAQDIVFPLQDNAIPSNLRIDFGENKKQGIIYINSFKVKYKNKILKIVGKDFYNYFQSGNIKALPEKHAIITKKVNGEVYDPMFYPNPVLAEKLKELISAKN